MENNIKKEIKISKSEEEEEKENNNQEKNNSYSKIANISNLENDQNDNDIEVELENDILAYYSHENENEKENELTQSQLERLNKIREEAQMRSERYSELSTNSNLIIKNTNSNKNNSNNLQSSNNIETTDTNDTISNLSHNFINNEYEESQNNEINPNLERIFNKIHPFLYINGEPLIIIGPDILYFIIIFTISSFFSIIFYSLKNKANIFMKMLYLLGYLFYAIAYILLMILNPGIPTKKNNIDLDELKKNYNQCKICNCIFYKNSGYITFHCHECNICVENFDHHCTFASKCIGKNNILIFKLWLFSIPCYIIIIFFYFIL